MLTALRIKNLALVSDLTLEFRPGYNAITGETGAGKSILIGALNLALGERADRTLIRGGSDSCAVEAVFKVPAMRAFLNDFCEQNGVEPCVEDELFIKRTFSAAGANRQFINGSPVALNTLAALGESLVDIHGPHDHQSLLNRGRQLAILDAFGGLLPLREEFAGYAKKRGELEAAKAALIVDERAYAQRIDLLRHQVHEITSAKLQVDEAAQLEADYARASNAAKLQELSQAALQQLTGDDGSLFTIAGGLGRTMQELQKVDPNAKCLLSLHEQVTAALRDLQSDLGHYAEKLELEPGRLQQLEERLNLLHTLQRKYGSTIEEVIAYGERASNELQQLEGRDAELEKIRNGLRKVDAEMLRVGNELSRQRKKLIPQFAKAVARELNDLGFKQAAFHATLTTEAASNSSAGFDTIEFEFAPNPGEPSKPLRAIASSGELARVMLALKTVLAGVDEIPVLVFDEIDANVGGETAGAVGEKMQSIGSKRQVLCITHLAPVAAHALTHYIVTKDVRDGRTLTEIKLLQPKDRQNELARMLGGHSDAALRHAAELLKP